MNKKGRLDREKLTREFSPDELKEHLNNIMEAEIKQPLKKMDVDLIDECAEWLLELNGQEMEIPEEKTRQRAKAIIAENYRPRRRFYQGYIRSAAAACMIILLSVQLISVAALGTNFFDWTKNKFLSLIGVENRQESMDLTASWSRRYESIEEFETAENINILSPAWLPDALKAKSINYFYNYDEGSYVRVLYYDDITWLRITLNSAIPNADGAKIYEHNDIIFYILEASKLIFWEYNGDLYNLSCGFDISEYAEKIIENIK